MWLDFHLSEKYRIGVFHKKSSLEGLTGLNWVLMGFMGQTGENSDSLCRFRIIEANLENQKIILHKMDY